MHIFNEKSGKTVVETFRRFLFTFNDCYRHIPLLLLPQRKSCGNCRRHVSPKHKSCLFSIICVSTRTNATQRKGHFHFMEKIGSDSVNCIVSRYHNLSSFVVCLLWACACLLCIMYLRTLLGINMAGIIWRFFCLVLLFFYVFFRENASYSSPPNCFNWQHYHIMYYYSKVSVIKLSPPYFYPSWINTVIIIPRMSYTLGTLSGRSGSFKKDGRSRGGRGSQNGNGWT